jgi:hypothetical protein
MGDDEKTGAASTTIKGVVHKPAQIILLEQPFPGVIPNPAKFTRHGSVKRNAKGLPDFVPSEGQPIKKKWVYVLYHNKENNRPKLIDELWLDRHSRVWCMRSGKRGRRMPPTAKNALRRKTGGYRPFFTERYSGIFYFYLSPLQLGERTIARMAEFIKWDHHGFSFGNSELRNTTTNQKEGKAGSPGYDSITREFNRLFAEAGAKYGEEVLAANIAWNEAREKDPNAILKQPFFDVRWRSVCGHSKKTDYEIGTLPYTSVRAAFNFDAYGKRRTKGFGFAGHPKSRNIILLPDPESWVEDHHEYGYVHALRLLAKYRNDRALSQMRIVANNVATENARDKSKSLSDEMIKLDFHNNVESKVYKLTDNELTKRVKRFSDCKCRKKHCSVCWSSTKERKAIVLEDHSVSITKNRLRKDKLRHRVSIPKDKYVAAHWKHTTPGRLFLSLNLARIEALSLHTDKWTTRLADVWESKCHRVICQEHCNAATESANSSTKILVQNSIRGLVHWTKTMTMLNETATGRHRLSKILAHEKQEFSLLCGLLPAPKKKAIYADALWHKAAVGATKSTNKFVGIVLAGALDKDFAKSKAKMKAFDWVDTFYGKLLGENAYGARGTAAGTKLRHLAPKMSKLAKSPLSDYEKTLITQRAESYQSIRAEKHLTVGAVLDNYDALLNVYKMMSKGEVSVKDLAGVAEVLIGNIDRLAKGALKSGKWSGDLARKVLSKSIDEAGALDLKLLGRVGNALGLIGAAIDWYTSIQELKGLTDMYTTVAVAKVIKVTGASVALGTAMWATFAGGTMSGPVGWIIVGASLGLSLSVDIIEDYFKNEDWRVAVRASFVGRKSEDVFIHLNAQQNLWILLPCHFSFEVKTDLTIELKPGHFQEGYHFEITIDPDRKSGQRVSQYWLKCGPKEPLLMSVDKCKPRKNVAEPGWTKDGKLQLKPHKELLAAKKKLLGGEFLKVQVRLHCGKHLCFPARAAVQATLYCQAVQNKTGEVVSTTYSGSSAKTQTILQ